MPPGKKPVAPQTRRTVLWFVLYMGCLLSGIAIAAMFIPSNASIAPFMQFMFALVLVLALVLVSLTGWQLTKLVTVARRGWRWAILLAAVAAGITVGLWTAAYVPADVPELQGFGAFLLGALGLTVAISLAMNSLVKIVSAGAVVPQGHQSPERR